VEAVGPLPADRDFGARGVAFSAPATSEEDARSKILLGVSGTVYVIIAGITGSGLPDRQCSEEHGRDGRGMPPGSSCR
jgi:hypothetical protein